MDAKSGPDTYNNRLITYILQITPEHAHKLAMQLKGISKV